LGGFFAAFWAVRRNICGHAGQQSCFQFGQCAHLGAAETFEMPIRVNKNRDPSALDVGTGLPDFSSSKQTKSGKNISKDCKLHQTALLYTKSL
jgi:hypothetical protein